MATQDRTSNRADALPLRQTFHAHQRAEFNAAIAAAGRKGGYLVDVETDSHGDTVVTLHRAQALHQVQS